ncbi:MAG: hypothetical protein JOZ23_16110 [Mycobacterium sp.]|nr:hypothetical protein [Mycobacterium sp.]
MSWDRVVDKFHWLDEPFADDGLRADIIAAVEHLEDIPIAELTRALGGGPTSTTAPGCVNRFGSAPAGL